LISWSIFIALSIPKSSQRSSKISWFSPFLQFLKKSSKVIDLFGSVSYPTGASVKPYKDAHPTFPDYAQFLLAIAFRCTLRLTQQMRLNSIYQRFLLLHPREPTRASIFWQNGEH